LSSYHQNQDENPHSHSPRIPLSSRRTPPPHLLLPFPSRPSDAPVPFPSRPSAALVLTTETVLESVDSCPALPKTTDDGPSPPAHSVPLVIPPAAVDDVEVCVCSGTMKNTLWVTPKRFRRLRSRILRCQRVKGQKKKTEKKNRKFGFRFRLSQPNHIGCQGRLSKKPKSYRGRTLMTSRVALLPCVRWY
jgi:hypothetical protein